MLHTSIPGRRKKKRAFNGKVRKFLCRVLGSIWLLFLYDIQVATNRRFNVASASACCKLQSRVEARRNKLEEELEEWFQGSRSGGQLRLRTRKGLIVQSRAHGMNDLHLLCAACSNLAEADEPGSHQSQQMMRITLRTKLWEQWSTHLCSRAS